MPALFHLVCPVFPSDEVEASSNGDETASYACANGRCGLTWSAEEWFPATGRSVYVPEGGV